MHTDATNSCQPSWWMNGFSSNLVCRCPIEYCISVPNYMAKGSFVTENKLKQAKCQELSTQNYPHLHTLYA